MRRRTRCSVTTAPDDGSRMLEKLSLSRHLKVLSDSSGARSEGGGLFLVAGPNTAKLRWPVEVRTLGKRRVAERN